MKSAEYSAALWALKLDKFIGIYPDKGNRKVAARVWSMIIPRSVAKLNYILRGAKAYAELVKAEDREFKYIKSMDSFLKEQCWELELQYSKAMPVNSASVKTGNHKTAEARKDDDTL